MCWLKALVLSGLEDSSAIGELGGVLLFAAFDQLGLQAGGGRFKVAAADGLL